jgi:hypothetical protein
MFANVTTTPPCDLCSAIAGQRRVVTIPHCAPGCDGVHIACNQCIRDAGIDPTTCLTA